MQGAIYQGTNVLANEPITTYEDEQGNTQNRIPALIVLTDGGTNIVTANGVGGATSGGPNWWEPYGGNTDSYEVPRYGGNYYTGPNWNPFYASASSNSLNYNGAIGPRTFAVLLGAARQKMIVEDHYKTTMRGYSIGYNISGLGRNELEQLYSTMDPANYFTANATAPSGAPDAGGAYNQARAAYQLWTQYKAGQTPTSSWKLNGEWVDHTVLQGYWRYNHPSTYDPASLDNLNYIDRFYVSSPGTLDDIFDDVYSQLGGIAFHPVSSGGTGGAGGIQYTDPVGEYMEVKAIKTLRLFNVDYPVRKNADGSYTVTDASGNDATITNPEYINPTTFKLSDIKITVSTQANPGTSSSATQPGIPDVGAQTVTVIFPEEALPLRKETIDLNAERDANGHQTVRSYTTNASTVVPLRLFYTVGVADAIKDTTGAVDLSKVNRDYRKNHSAIDDSGNQVVEFYANVYHGTHGDEVGAGIGNYTVGDAAVEFSPDESNRYYYFQKNRVIYTAGTEGVIGQGGAITGTPVTAASLDPNSTYYLVIDFYGPQASSRSGYGYLEYVVARTGAELDGDVARAVTYIDKLPSGYYTNSAVAEYDDQPASGRVMATKRGGVRLGRLNAFSTAKSVANGGATATADYNFVPTYSKANVDDEHFVVYQGNNGRVRVTDTALQVTKIVERTRDANGNALSYNNEPDFHYTITFTGLANKTVEATSYSYVDGDWVETKNDAGQVATQILTLDGNGTATFTLKNGQGLRFRDLPAGITYTVVEGTDVTGVDAGMSDVLGQPDPDSFFEYLRLNGVGTIDDEARSIVGTTTRSVVQRADYVNRFTKTAEVNRTLPIYKELQGREFDPTDTFTFIMTAGGQSEGGVANTPMPQGKYTSADGSTYTRTIGPNITGTEVPGTDPVAYRSDDPLLFIGETTAGTADPDTVITYTQPGTYTYIFREQRPTGGSSIAGITYENTIYRLRVTVRVQNNFLVAEATSIERRDGDTGTYTPYWTPEDGDPSLTFRNVYNTNDVARTFQGRKVLTGHSLAAGQFGFTLSALGSHPVVLDTTYDALKDTSPLSAEEKIAWIEERIGNTVEGVTIPGWDTRDAKQPMPGNNEPGYRFMPVVEATNGEGGLVTFGEAHFDDSLPLTSDDPSTNLRGVIYKYQVLENQPTDTKLYDGTGLPGGTEEGKTYAAATKIDHDNDPATPERWYYKGIIYDPTPKVFYVYAHLDEVTDPAGDAGTIIHASVLGAMPFNLETGENYENIYRSTTAMPLTGVKTITGRPFQGADAATGVVADSFTFHVSGELVSGNATAIPMPDKLAADNTLTITPTEGTSAPLDFGAIAFTDDDAGNTYRYTITEAGSGINGVTHDTTPRVILVSVADDGFGSLSYKVTDSQGNEVSSNPVSTWVNTYAPQSIGVNYEGHKSFLNHPLTAGVFGFEITQTDATGKPIENGMTQRVTNGEGVAVTGSTDPEISRGSIGLLSASWARFTEVGQYYFLVDETETPNLPDNSAVNFDPRQFLLTVAVTDNHMGALQASVTQVQQRMSPEAAWTAVAPEADGSFNVEFVNEYEGQTMQILSLRKQFVGTATEVMNPHTFVISAEPQNGSPADGVRLPEKSEIQNTTDGTLQFDPVVFTREGTYAIHVREKQPTVDGTFEGEGLPGAHKITVDGVERWYYQGVNYDTHTATSIFEVARNDQTGNLVATRVSTTTTRVFTNYTNLTVEKQLQGHLTEEEANEDFTFKVQAWTAPEVGETANNPVVGTYRVEVYTMADDQLVADGQTEVTFEAAENGIEGEGFLTIKGGQIAQIIGLPTDCGYTITEELTEDQLQNWTLIEPVEGAVSGSLSLGVNSHYVFVNRKGQPDNMEAPAYLTAQKVVTTPAELDPYELEAGQFGFMLYPMPDNPAGDPLKEPLRVTNDEDGTVSVMDGLVYTQPGTYCYELLEDPRNPLSDMIYDASTYEVTVVAERDEYGFFTTQVTLTKDGQPYDGSSPQFENHYQPGIVSATFQGKKILNGRPLTNREFTFQLKPLGAQVAEIDTAAMEAAAAADNESERATVPDSSAEVTPAVPVDPESATGTPTEASPVPGTDQSPTEGSEDVSEAAMVEPQTEPGEEQPDADTALEEETPEPETVPGTDGDDQETPPANGPVSGSTPDGDEESVTPDGEAEDEDQGASTKPNKVIFTEDWVELDAASMPMPGNALNDEAGLRALATNYFGEEFYFGAIPFDRPGLYTYAITELNDGKEHIVYDETTYVLEVLVSESEDADGSLRASVRVIEPAAATDVVFTNSYVEPPTPETPTPVPSGSTPEPTGETIPNTGDQSTVAFWSLVAVAAFGCMVVAMQQLRRLRKWATHRPRHRR